jgi:dihydromonapterin reductase/dihydrofolate reductase
VSDDPVLITGVGRRAGFHLAECLLRRGFAVIGTYRTRYERLDELEQLGGELIHCDFDSRSAVEGLVESIQQRHTGLRAVIHNASSWLPDDDELPAAEVIERMMRIHAGVPYELNLALTPLLLACREPHADIIHIGDYVSSRGSKKHIAYAASKAAQDNLTYSFAAKLAPKVKVNSLAPALLLFNEGDPADYREKALAKSLMRREGGLDELQQAVDYLMGSRYVTGRILPLDGGRHLR